VCDTGVGIAPEMLEGIFDLFTQVDRSLSRFDRAAASPLAKRAIVAMNCRMGSTMLRTVAIDTVSSRMSTAPLMSAIVARARVEKSADVC
jgi:hypothetical protein